MNHFKARQRSKKPTNFGFIPLHVACLENDVESVHKLLRIYPRGTRVSAPVDGCPIHVACGSRWYKEFHGSKSTEIVRKLIQYDKETLCTKNPKGKIPLHLALGHQHIPLEILRLLTESCKESLRIPTQETFHSMFVFEALPIHMAIQHQRQSVIEIIVKAQPDAILVPCSGEDDTGLLCLFVALSRIRDEDGTPVLDLDKIQTVLTIFHDAKVSSNKTERRDFLLHMILSWPLFSHQSKRLTFLDRNGRWFSHWQSDFVSILERLMLVGGPEDATDDSSSSNTEQLTLIPSALKMLDSKDSSSNLPLHVALQSGHCISIVMFLLEKYPEAAKERGGSQGHFPLLMALKQPNPDPALVRLLWKRHKVAALQMDRETRMYPFQLAILNMERTVGCEDSWQSLSYQMLREFPQFILCNI